MSLTGWPNSSYSPMLRPPLAGFSRPVDNTPRAFLPYFMNFPATASVVNLKGFSALPGGFVSASRAQATQVKEWGNTLFKTNQFPAAAMAYRQAIALDPTYPDPVFNLGKTCMMLRDYEGAIGAFTRVLQLDPRDNEARVLLAKSLEKSGQIMPAIIEYQNVLRQNPRYDPAHRRAQLLQARLASPQDYGRRMMDIVGHRNLESARQLVKAYLINAPHVPKAKRQALEKLLQNVPVSFDTTQSLNGSANMGEYIHLGENTRGIRLKSELAFAHPNVIGAYWVHELLHALDNDGLSSVQEEQECYLESTRFWETYKGQIEDPNLDLALLLYQQQPDQPVELFQKISDLYLSRNPAMALVSPGHGLPLASQNMGRSAAISLIG